MTRSILALWADNPERGVYRMIDSAMAFGTTYARIAILIYPPVIYIREEGCTRCLLSHSV